MFSARAYSFRQKARLAISLSWVGGYTNVIVLLFCGAVVSHVTGSTTYAARSMAKSDWTDAVFFGFLWVTFFSGAVMSAFMTEGARRRGMASKYILPIALEAMLLTVLGFHIHRHPMLIPSEVGLRFWLAGIASFAMGLQNATITKISGAVIRTTHLTGVTTDLGLEGVQWLLWYYDRAWGRKWSRTGRVLMASPRHPSFQRVLLLASIVGSFLFGATVGAIAFIHIGATALAFPVLFLGWIIFVDWHTPIADVREIDLAADSELKLLGIVKTLLPPDLGIWRVAGRQGRHKAPDFQQWADRVPAHWRVIVLALSPVTPFTANAIEDLKSALQKLRDAGHSPVLCGITPLQYRALLAGGVGQIIDVENICTDLEFAIARGIDLLSSSAAASTAPAAAQNGSTFHLDHQG